MQENSADQSRSPELIECFNRFEAAWQQPGAPPRIVDYLPALQADDPRCREALIELVRIDLEYRWRRADEPVESQSLLISSAPSLEPYRPLVDDYVARFSELAPREALPPSLIAHEYLVRHQWGDRPSHDEYASRFPTIVDVLLVRLQKIDQEIAAHSTARGLPAATNGATSDTKAWNAPAPRNCPLALPKYGRYEVERELDRGSFGVVYLAHDPQLQRRVAIKVPILADADLHQRANYLAEARNAAKLDHPGLVRVYDVGEAGNGVIFVVMEYVEGQTLAARLSRGAIPWREAANLMAQIAEAVHHAHKQGFVHRDLKPANILLDLRGIPHVADLGLALHEDDQCNRAGDDSGTLFYSAPEQVRGEAHRLDGRADIWALGVILFEMLTGRRPFTGNTKAALRDEILHREPKPPRQIDEGIPEQLQSICLKALSKAIPDRHTSAFDLAKRLRSILKSDDASLSPRWIAATVGIVACALGMWFVLGRDRSPQIGSHPTTVAVQVSLDFSIRVWQNNQQRDLAAAVPVRSGDDVQITCEVSRELHPTIFWFDTEGKLVALTPQLAEERGAVARYVWPKSGHSQVLAGPAGTELVLVCASADAPPTLEQLEPLLAGGPWPAIAARAMVKLDNERVQFLGDRGLSSESRDRPTDTAMGKCEQLQQSLIEKFALVRGVAFSHAESFPGK